MKECQFSGQLLTSEDISINQTEVNAIMKMDAPQSKKDMESFQGMVNYLKWYSSRLKQVAEPIEGTPEKWHVMVLEIQTPGGIWSHQVGATLCSSLAYFDPKIDHNIQVDGSMKSLDAVLLQKGRPVICMSWTLMSAETGYSNIERELLSIIFRFERLHLCIFGRKVVVQTDHKPLIPSWMKSIVAASPWHQWLLLWLAKYDVELTYLKGKDNVITDTLTYVRPMSPEAVDKDDFDTIWVHHIMLEVSATEILLERVRVETQADPVLSHLNYQIFQGWPDARSIPESIHTFWNYRDELSVEDGLIFIAKSWWSQHPRSKNFSRIYMFAIYRGRKPYSEPKNAYTDQA